MDPAAQQHKSQRSRKTQLKTDASGGIGVEKEQQQERSAEAGKAVAVTLEERGRQQRDLHDAGTNHGGSHSHHDHVEQKGATGNDGE